MAYSGSSKTAPQLDRLLQKIKVELFYEHCCTFRTHLVKTIVLTTSRRAISGAIHQLWILSILFRGGAILKNICQSV